ncbi:MAG: thiopurine S-methyltransferase [Pseudomonadota bacterium]|nr:thiopurine S-methyltransferase [Pseudomonadota bacterium]
MHPDYWKTRWQHGETGWHRQEVMPLLQKHWPALAARAGEQVLVPLCGKTLDMPWLAAQGHPVLGIEISAHGIAAFFDEQGWQAEVSATAHGALHRAGQIAILEADAFALDAETLADYPLVYDRAALIALPAELRRRYVDTLYARLPLGTRALLITLEYPQAEKAGPPFAVSEDEVVALFSPQWQIQRLERRDILAQQPAFIAEGVSALHTAVYRLRKTAAP